MTPLTDEEVAEMARPPKHTGAARYFAEHIMAMAREGETATIDQNVPLMAKCLGEIKACVNAFLNERADRK